LNKNKTPVSFPIDNLNEYIQELNAPEGLHAVLFSFAEGTKSAKFTAETSFVSDKLWPKSTKRQSFALNRITYDNEVLLIDSVKRTREFLRKKVKRRFFRKKWPVFTKGI
jgi:hypothetical protein